MTLCTLHLYGLAVPVVGGAMATGDVLRVVNAPWLAVLPPEGEEDEGAERLFRMGKALTKNHPGAVAMHFYYYDDDSFTVRVCREGRCLKTMSDGQSWSYLGRLLNELYDDDQPAKALRMRSQCLDMRERLELMEQTMGTALYDGQWMEPRRVSRSSDMAECLKARASKLRKTRNQYQLVPVSMENWPEYPRACAELAAMLPKTYEAGYYDVMTDPLFLRFSVPHQPWRVCRLDRSGRERRLTFYDSHTKRVKIMTSPLKIERTLWVTREGFPVAAAFGSDGAGLKTVVCMDETGRERWRFDPALKQFQGLSWTMPTREGVLTLWSENFEGASTRLWRIEGESGKMLDELDIPFKAVMYVECLDRFLALDKERRELVVLNEKMEAVNRWPLGDRPLILEYGRVFGHNLWSVLPDHGIFYGIDLTDGTIRTVRPELSVMLSAVLRDGTLACESDNGALMLFDAQGRLMSRHRLEGFRIDDRVVEVVGIPGNAMITQEVLDHVGIRVWDIEPVSQS